jgi:hypothetical protein
MSENQKALSAEQSLPPRTELTAPKNLTKYFEFLDKLRESGATNMYGASPYLETAFRLKRGPAVVVLRQWMETFDGKSSAEDRAISAISKAKGAT